MEGAIHPVRGADRDALEQALSHQDRVTKPLNSPGVLKEDIARIIGASGSRHIPIDRKAIMVMCADSGVVEEGVTQTGQEVTAIVAGNMGKGCSCVYLIAEKAGAKVVPVDVDMNCYGEIPGVIPGKISMGTKNLLREPAMNREQMVMAMEAGIRIVESLKSRGYNLAGSGEMGIGNTTTSSMVLSALLGQGPGQVTGRGIGLTAEGYKRKIRVIEDRTALHGPSRGDPVDVLPKVGGLDLAALVGFYIGCKAMGLSVAIDGLTTGAAALAVVNICPPVKDYPLTSRISAGPAGTMVLRVLGLKSVIQAGMHPGEGTGVATLLPLLDMAAVMYDRMSSFEETHAGQYEYLKWWNRIWIGSGGTKGRK